MLTQWSPYVMCQVSGVMCHMSHATCLVQFKVKFQISKVLVYFEVAVAQAISKVWGASVKGCLFHFFQAIWRFCQTSKMVQCFVSCSEFREFIKMVMALSHVGKSRRSGQFQGLSTGLCLRLLDRWAFSSTHLKCLPQTLCPNQQ